MKSHYESYSHTKIRKQRELEREEARAFLNENSVEMKDMTREKASKVLLNDLTPSIRRLTRNRALENDRLKKRGVQLQGRIKALLKRVRAVSATKSEIDEKSPITLEALREWLGEIGEVNIREDRDRFYWASIPGVTLENSLLQPQAQSRSEIMGRDPDDALRSYFKNATTPGTHMLKGDDVYDWKLADLTFIRRDVISLEEQVGIRKEKIQRRRILGKEAQKEGEK